MVDLPTKANTPNHDGPSPLHGAMVATSASSSDSTQAFTLLRDITAAVNSSLILDDIFDSLGDVLRQYFPYREATIVVFDETLNGIKLLVRMLENGLLDFRSEHNRFTGDDPLLRQLIFHPRPLFLAGSATLEAVQPSLVLPPWTTTSLVVPLVNKGVMLGVLALSTDCVPNSGDVDLPSTENSARPLTNEHLDLLHSVTSPIAVAMENAKLYWQTQQQAGREFLTNQITKAVRQSLSVDDILTTAATTLGQTTGVSRCIIRYFGQPLTRGQNDLTDDPTGRVYTFTTPNHPDFNEDDVHRFDLERRVLCQRLASLSTNLRDHSTQLNPFILNDIQDCPDDIARQQTLNSKGIQSLAIFPICVGAHADKTCCVGSITLHQCDQLRVWLEEDLTLFSTIAEHLGLALHQADLYASQERQTQKLQETLEELQQAQLQLIQSEKMAVIGQFVAGIAHEVNTPLGAITSNQQTLKQCVDTIQTALTDNVPIPETILTTMEKLLGVNELAATRMDEIVRNLRNFARLDETALKAIDLRESLSSTRLLLDRPLKDASITLLEDMPDNLPEVTCYPGLFNQVLMNVTVNAIHALEGTENPSITVKITMNTTECWVDVIDNGPGIPDQVLPKIFDPGFTTKGVGVGTGLGLALCYRIMAKHNGRIDVANTGPTGTTMRLVLPIV